MIVLVSFPSRVNRGKVLADGAAVIEPDASVDRDPRSDRHRVARERGGGDEQTAGIERIRGDRLKRLPVVVEYLTPPGMTVGP